MPQKLGREKFYVHEIAAVNLSKIYFVKNAKKTCKQNNRNLNRDGKTLVSIHIECKSFKMKTLIYFLFHHELLINGPFFKIFLK